MERELSTLQTSKYLAQLLKDEGYSVPNDEGLAKGLFGFNALNNILLDETMLTLVETRMGYLGPFLEEYFGHSNQDVPVDVYKETSIALVPLLNEVTISTKANKSKHLLGIQKIYNEQKIQGDLYKQFQRLEVVGKMDQNTKDIKEYQMLKITEQMYLKTFEFEKRKLATAIVTNMKPMEFIIPHLYSLVTDQTIRLSDDEMHEAKNSTGFRECSRAITALTNEDDITFMPEPQRRVKMTNLVIEYFLKCYKSFTVRNIPVVKNAL